MPFDKSKSRVPSSKASTSRAPASKAGEVDAFLAKVRATPVAPKAPGKRGRLIFAMDATASREPTWDQACRIQGEMFEATDQLGGLDIQMVDYGGFREFTASKWVSSAHDLLSHMTRVRCRGGQTQIERVLGHVAKESEKEKVDAVVFVGDAFEEDIDAACHRAGLLGLKGVPMFMFQEGNDPLATRAFQEIARLSGGAHCRFDAGSAKQLKDLLAAVAVFAVGGHRALADFSKRRGGQLPLLTDQMARKR
ncbi:MAG: VWA domain-containing protein [Alphaproteobacteria bacterium]|nr:VWA domain-containing protein [Alphaproteobacteria bacterium]